MGTKLHHRQSPRLAFPYRTVDIPCRLLRAMPRRLQRQFSLSRVTAGPAMAAPEGATKEEPCGKWLGAGCECWCVQAEDATLAVSQTQVAGQRGSGGHRADKSGLPGARGDSLRPSECSHSSQHALEPLIEFGYCPQTIHKLSACGVQCCPISAQEVRLRGTLCQHCRAVLSQPPRLTGL